MVDSCSDGGTMDPLGVGTGSGAPFMLDISRRSKEGCARSSILQQQLWHMMAAKDSAVSAWILALKIFKGCRGGRRKDAIARVFVVLKMLFRRCNNLVEYWKKHEPTHFLYLLQVCASLRALDMGREIRQELLR